MKFSSLENTNLQLLNPMTLDKNARDRALRRKVVWTTNNKICNERNKSIDSVEELIISTDSTKIRYVLTVKTKCGYVSTLLNQKKMWSAVLDLSKICFHRARPKKKRALPCFTQATYFDCPDYKKLLDRGCAQQKRLRV